MYWKRRCVLLNKMDTCGYIVHFCFNNGLTEKLSSLSYLRKNVQKIELNKILTMSIMCNLQLPTTDKSRVLVRGIKQRRRGRERWDWKEGSRRNLTEFEMSKKTYDLTPDQREIALYRDAKRKQLRELYLRDSGHPTKSLLFDTGIYRYASAKTAIEKYFVPTAMGYITRFGAIVGLIVFTAVNLKRRRDKREHMYRTGQIGYENRKHQFC